MFEKLKEWFGSFKNKVTTAMSFVGGAAATAALLPIPMPTWLRIGLGVVAAAAPVVSTVHATVKYAKNKKQNRQALTLVESLTVEAEATTEVENARAKAIAACTDEIRKGDSDKAVEAAEAIDRQKILSAMVSDPEPEEVKTEEVKSSDKKAIIMSIMTDSDADNVQESVSVETLVSDDTDEEKAEAAVKAVTADIINDTDTATAEQKKLAEEIMGEVADLTDKPKGERRLTRSERRRQSKENRSAKSKYGKKFTLRSRTINSVDSEAKVRRDINLINAIPSRHDYDALSSYPTYRVDPNYREKYDIRNAYFNDYCW